MPKGIFIRTQEFRRKLAEIRKLRHLGFGNKNPNWKGDNVGYSCLHKWATRHKPKPEFCEICGIKPLVTWLT